MRGRVWSQRRDRWRWRIEVGGRVVYLSPSFSSTSAEAADRCRAQMRARSQPWPLGPFCIVLESIMDPRTSSRSRYKVGITLDELGALVQRAHRLGLPGDTPVRVSGLGWRSQIRTIELVPKPSTTTEK